MIATIFRCFSWFQPRSPSIYDNVSLPGDTPTDTAMVQADSATSTTVHTKTTASSPLEARMPLGSTTGTQTSTPPYSPTGRFPVEAVRIFVPYHSRDEPGSDRDNKVDHILDQRTSPANSALQSPTVPSSQGHSSQGGSPTGGVQDPNRITIKVHAMTTVETLWTS